jgi:STE24 endopeptidase
VNEPKSARYHRLKRQAGIASVLCTAVVLAALLWTHTRIGIVALLLLLEAVAFPFTFYRSFLLERRYELSSESPSAWLQDQAKALALMLVLASGAGYIVYALIRWNAEWWWLPAALLAAAATVLLAKAAPIFLLPLFYKFTPLDRPALVERLMQLSRKAHVPVLGAYEWGLGAKTRRANAALVGSGSTRRILLSDTLLSEYTDDEIEVILAHEMAHHVHHDIGKGLLLETALLVVACYSASVALRAAWQPLGLSSPADVGGLPLLLLAGGAVTLIATPLANAFSRRNERKADSFALALTGQRPAFVSAMRRLASQNLAEENPSRATVVLFHTHPPIEERITAASCGG